MAVSISGNNIKERKDWVDFIRGLAVLLVVIGHANSSTYPFFLFTSPIKMPLFFVVSGYLFNNRNGSYPVFLKNLFIRIIIPWLFLGLFPIVFMIPLKGFEVFPQYLMKMISGESIWFMPCFIIGEILFFSTLRFFEKKEVGVIFVSLLLAGIGYYLTKRHCLDYGMTNRAMTVQAFFLMGWVFRKHEEKLFKIKWWYVVSGLLGYLAICVFNYSIYPDMSIDVHIGEYLNPGISVLQISLGCWLSFAIAKSIKQYPKWSTQFGKDSLLIYIWSPYIMLGLLKLSRLITPIDGSFWWLSIIAIISCCVCCLIAMPINKYTPVLLGKRNRNGKR